jgi:hypothetical protein
LAPLAPYPTPDAQTLSPSLKTSKFKNQTKTLEPCISHTSPNPEPKSPNKITKSLTRFFDKQSYLKVKPEDYKTLKTMIENNESDFRPISHIKIQGNASKRQILDFEKLQMAKLLQKSEKDIKKTENHNKL